MSVYNAFVSSDPVTTLHTSPSDAKSPLRLMLIEDCRLVRMGLRTLLLEDSELTIVAEDEGCQGAINTLKQLIATGKPPDIVLLDIGLGSENGLTLIPIFIDLLPTLRYVVLTSHESADELKEALALGVQGYCLKQIATPLLVKVIKMVHEGALWVDPAMAHYIAQFVKKSQRTGGYTLPIKVVTGSQAFINRRVQFSERELNVLELLCQGKCNADIADTLSISVHTAKYYVSSIIAKLEATDRVEAAVKAVKLGLI
jgi:two-component system, NarL family, response regulator LiaR